MNHSFYSLGIFLIIFVRFSLCIINETVESDFWDDYEPFHADFSLSAEMSNECEILENQSMINQPHRNDEPANAMQTVVPGEPHFDTTAPLLIDASHQLEELLSQLQNEVPQQTFTETTIPRQPQPSNQMESTSEMHDDIEMTEAETTRVTDHTQKYFQRFVTIGLGAKTAWGNASIFKKLSPWISNAQKISQEEEIEIILYSLRNDHQWEELRNYPVQTYFGYWANVCDYFWVKITLDEELFRGCSVGSRIFPALGTLIHHIIRGMDLKSANIDILKCQCYFFRDYRKKLNSTISIFSVHKYRDSQYLILRKIPGLRNSYSIIDLLTQVYLPDPQNISVSPESNQSEESRTELQSDTEMIAGSARLNEQRNLPRKKFVSIKGRSRRAQKASVLFSNVSPGKSNRHNLSQEQLELEFISQKNKPQWKEIKEYSLDKYLGYWGNVCDYFWKKSQPDDERNRGCWVGTSYYPYSCVSVALSQASDSVESRKLDVLQCQCYYYVNYQIRPDSEQTEFAIHKHRENEYFVLVKIPNEKYRHKILDFITEVYLPDPVQ